MTAWLVWVKQIYGKEELQVWYFNPAKMLRKPENITRTKEIPVEIAEKLTIDELGKVYGSELGN